MSLTVKLKQFQIAKCKGDKIVRVEFRGAAHVTDVIPDTGELLIIDQRFEWPVARPVESHETLTIELVVQSRLFPNRVWGTYGLVLQSVVKEGRLQVADTLVDPNNKPLPATVCFDVGYIPPGSSSSTFSGSGTYETLDDDQQMLIDIEQNIANLEKSLVQDQRQAGDVTSTSGTRSRTDKSPQQRKRSSTLRSVRSLIRLGKQRPPRESSTEDESRSLLRDEQPPETPSNPMSRTGSQTSLSSDNDSQLSISIAEKSKKTSKLRQEIDKMQSALKAQDFQVCITIIEARQLAGLNMDPVVCIQVGDQKKYTSVKESTNCPYYNEYFVFDFHMPALMLFDKIITLSVLQSRTFLRANKLLGSFKLDVATVWSQPDHQFFHKWALLTDPDDIAGGPKGYLKCDISVIGKGDSVKVPPKSEKDEDDIEANLLLPDGVSIERQRARFLIRIYRANGLPKMNSSLMANVKMAFTRENRDLVNPFVEVSFAGLSGRTSVKKNCYAPVWNEQLVFTEMFPPLCQRIKIQLCDEKSVKPTVIGTHFIDLKTIAHDGEKGFLPTFGPTFIHLYGSTRDYSLIDSLSNLNDGLGEGVSYRGQLLIAIRTEITDVIDLAPANVELEPITPIYEHSYGKQEEFFLLATILDATMIEKRLADKPLYFEISVGNAGNSLDGYNESASLEQRAEDEEIEIVIGEEYCQSTTSPTKPMTHDKQNFFLPIWDNKPCMHVRSVWPDYRRRMYNSNIISKILDKLEEGLHEVRSLMDADSSETEIVLRNVLEELSISCTKYVSITTAKASAPGTGKTKLDKERIKLCLRVIEGIGNSARNLRAIVTKNSCRERYRSAYHFVDSLKFIMEDPQHSIPDVFIWAISAGKRTAYQRIPARDIIYSIVDEECGRYCGKVQTLFLKLPGNKGTGPSGWTIQAKLHIYLWLGILKHKKHFYLGLPKGFEMSQEIKNADRPRALPPSNIHYMEKHAFQLRAHIYQARSLIGSDASGLSDPYALVFAGEFSKTTQVIDETLSPTWDELLVFDEILIYGTRDDIERNPPTIIIEIYDQDNMGKSEFIGRALAKPHVKLFDVPYTKPRFPPSLEWFDISRGSNSAGELLATFELLELSPNNDTTSLPNLPPIKALKHAGAVSIYVDKGPLLPVPRGIRPTLARYRIEVLFWGLRYLKRVHLLTVNKPRVDIECSGHILYSSIIQNANKNPNFIKPVKFMELELPEQELYRPPLTIRAVDCRSFGRYTLVGTHMINSIQKYMFHPMTKQEAEERKRSLQIQNIDSQDNQHTSSNLTIESDPPRERSPLLLKDLESTSYGTNLKKKEFKTETGKSRRRSSNLSGDLAEDDDALDWWTKYFASIEVTIEESKVAKNINGIFNQNGTEQSVPVDNNPWEPSGSNKKLQNVESQKKKTFGLYSAATAGRFVGKAHQKRVANKTSKTKPKTVLLKIYPNELEEQPEYDEFREWLNSFDLYRGKKTDDDSEDDARIVGTFKGSIKVYKWPLPKDIADHTIMGFDPQYGFFQGLPSNDPIHVLVRVYIVKAHDLHPMDLNGKADPYIVLQMGSKRISDKENYVSKQLNPVFGKCFEIEATFPQDSMLTVQVLDWDLVSADDLIGETKIDLENRFYSRHRATCGLSASYNESSYNKWRDPMKPTQILAKLCKEAKFDPPAYMSNQVKIGRHLISVPIAGLTMEPNVKGLEEYMALTVLHRWHEIPRIGCHLVPEHIETRSLYNPSKPGIEHGKLEMWVDMFPMDMPLPGPPIDIAPRKPKSYELRVIIWNTDEVVLEDDAYFTGEKMSDIYVKGWLKGPEDCQCTDTHYRSLTGEGNFNWRFIYPFDYMVAEEKIVINRKETIFSWDETECKIPARLHLQVWDADHFSSDDFLGAISLDLNRFPRGANSAKLCTLDMLKVDHTVPMVNIFKQKRIKGWWPFFIKNENDDMELTGKVEAEFHLLTKDEAIKNPVGFGRSEPDPLDKPNRPDSSFMWFMNPMKSIRHIIWHNYKWKIMQVFFILVLVTIILLFIYSIPGYSVKKLMGA